MAAIASHFVCDSQPGNSNADQWLQRLQLSKTIDSIQPWLCLFYTKLSTESTQHTLRHCPSYGNQHSSDDTATIDSYPSPANRILHQNRTSNQHRNQLSHLNDDWIPNPTDNSHCIHNFHLLCTENISTTSTPTKHLPPNNHHTSPSTPYTIEHISSSGSTSTILQRWEYDSKLISAEF